MAGIIVLASSIQLEATGSRGIFPVWFHIVSATIFTALVFYHIFLHFRWTDWFAKFSKLKSKVTDILWWLFLVTTVTGGGNSFFNVADCFHPLAFWSRSW